jgi:hypothetical protein
MDSTFWLNLGIAGAVVFVVRLFLHHLKQERSDRSDERQSFVAIIANHIDHEREALEKLTDAIRTLQALLEKCVRPLEKKSSGR